MKALIDGDIIVYSAGAAADYRYYEVDDREFQDMASARLYVEETYGIPSKTLEDKQKQNAFIQRRVDPAPVQYSFSNCKGLIHAIMESTGANKALMFLTSDDKSNYRYARATIKPYKGQRDADGKPFWYNEIRKYLVSQWGAGVVYGREADDAMGCEQYAAERAYWDGKLSGEDGQADRTILCTKDKDLDMIPGWHYNWHTDHAYEVSDEQAWRNFYFQLLIGDSTDNISGVPGIGKKNKLAVAIRDGEEPFDRAAIEHLILGKYEEKYEGNGWEIMRENADLLWIQREEGKLWEPVIEAPVSEEQGEAVAAVGDEEVDPLLRVGT